MVNQLFESIYPEEIYRFGPPVTVVLADSFSGISQAERELLNKILRAIGLSLESVRISVQQEFNASRWTEKPSRVIAFITPPKGINPYEVIDTNGMSVVFSDPIKKISEDEPSKRKLWSALKALFAA